MRTYHVVEKSHGTTRYMCADDLWSRNMLMGGVFTEREARRIAEQLNEKYAAEAAWCRYDARPTVGMCAPIGSPEAAERPAVSELGAGDNG